MSYTPNTIISSILITKTIPSEDGSTYKYEISIQSEIGQDNQWTVHKRFSEFDALLHELARNDYGLLPTLPPKTLLGLAPTDDKSINMRKSQLENLVFELLSRPDIFYSEAMIKFLDLDKHIEDVHKYSKLSCLRDFEDSRFSASGLTYFNNTLMASFEDATHLARLGKVWNVVEEDELGSFHIWQGDGVAWKRCVAKTFGVRVCALTCCNGEVCVGLHDGHVLVYSVRDCDKPVHVFKNLHSNCSVTHLSASEDKKRILSLGYDHCMRVIDLPKREIHCGGRLTKRLQETQGSGLVSVVTSSASALVEGATSVVGSLLGNNNLSNDEKTSPQQAGNKANTDLYLTFGLLEDKSDRAFIGTSGRDFYIFDVSKGPKPSFLFSISTVSNGPITGLLIPITKRGAVAISNLHLFVSHSSTVSVYSLEQRGHEGRMSRIGEYNAKTISVNNSISNKFTRTSINVCSIAVCLERKLLAGGLSNGVVCIWHLSSGNIVMASNHTTSSSIVGKAGIIPQPSLESCPFVKPHGASSNSNNGISSASGVAPAKCGINLAMFDCESGCLLTGGDDGRILAWQIPSGADFTKSWNRDANHLGSSSKRVIGKKTETFKGGDVVLSAAKGGGSSLATLVNSDEDDEEENDRKLFI